VFRGKPVAVVGVSPGGFGTVLGQSAWLPVLRTLRARHWMAERLMVSHASQVFDDAGNLVDKKVRERLESFVGGFIDYCGG
jgi:NAD(P)H-dependent FMN reductase